MDSKSFCSASAAGINTKPEGKLTCGYSGKVSEITWQFIKREEKADVYQFTRRFPVDKPESRTEQKTIEYAGDRVIVFEDASQVIVLQALEPKKSAK